MQDIDWDNEFLSMQKTLCNYFSIVNNTNLKLVNGSDKDVEIETGDDIEEMWDEIFDDDDKIYLK